MSGSCGNITALFGSAFLLSCATIHRSDADAVCAASEQTFLYRAADGNQLRITDGESNIAVTGLGTSSAHGDYWYLYITRDQNGIVVRNYGAINNILMSGGSWEQETLSCQPFKTGTSVEVTCKNAFGDAAGYRYEPGRGLTELFVTDGKTRSVVKLVGDKGIFWSCNF